MENEKAVEELWAKEDIAEEATKTKTVVQEASNTTNEEPVEECQCGEEHKAEESDQTDEKVEVKIVAGVPVGRTYINEDGKESRVEREVRLAKEWEAKGDDDGDSMLGYVEMCYDAALALYKLFAEQGHSGMSAHITKNMFVKIVNGDPLSPITGEEHEWYNANERYDEGVLVGYSRQNNRMTSLFKNYDVDMNFLSHSYIDVVKVTNDSKVWETYPPLDCAGSLDDDHPTVKKYFDQRRAMREKHCAEIKLPTSKFPTFYYTWNFETETLEESVPCE